MRLQQLANQVAGSSTSQCRIAFPEKGIAIETDSFSGTTPQELLVHIKEIFDAALKEKGYYCVEIKWNTLKKVQHRESAFIIQAKGIEIDIQPRTLFKTFEEICQQQEKISLRPGQRLTLTDLDYTLLSPIKGKPAEQRYSILVNLLESKVPSGTRFILEPKGIFKSKQTKKHPESITISADEGLELEVYRPTLWRSLKNKINTIWTAFKNLFNIFKS